MTEYRLSGTATVQLTIHADDVFIVEVEGPDQPLLTMTEYVTGRLREMCCGITDVRIHVADAALAEDES